MSFHPIVFWMNSSQIPPVPAVPYLYFCFMIKKGYWNNMVYNPLSAMSEKHFYYRFI